MTARFEVVLTGVKPVDEIDLDPHSWEIEAPMVRIIFKPPAGGSVTIIADCMTAGELDANIAAFKEALDAVAAHAKDVLANEKRRLGHSGMS